MVAVWIFRRVRSFFSAKCFKKTRSFVEIPYHLVISKFRSSGRYNYLSQAISTIRVLVRANSTSGSSFERVTKRKYTISIAKGKEKGETCMRRENMYSLRDVGFGVIFKYAALSLCMLGNFSYVTRLLAPWARQNTAQVVKIYSDTTHQNT